MKLSLHAIPVYTLDIRRLVPDPTLGHLVRVVIFDVRPV
jgi:hypothetical protein